MRRVHTCPIIPTSSGAIRSPSAPTTSSSSAAAGTAWRPPTTWPTTTASPMSRCSRRAGSPAATWPATPPSSARTTCGTRARGIYEHALKLWEGLEDDLGLPDPVQPARRAQPRAQPAGRPRQRAPGRRQPAQRHRRRVAGPGRGQEALPDRQHLARHPLPGARGDLPTARGHRQARLRRLGFRPPRRRGRGRPDPGLRGHRVRHRRRPGRPGCAPPAATSRPGRSRCARPGTPSVLADMLGIPAAAPEPPAAGAGLRTARAGAPDGRDVQRRPRLRVARRTRASW